MIKNLEIQISEFFNKEKIKGTVVEFNTSETEGNREKATANDDSKSLLDDYIHPKSIWPDPASGAIEYAPFNVEGLIILFSGIKGITLLGKAVWKLGVKSFGKAAAKGGTKLLTQFSKSTIDDAVGVVMRDPNKVSHLFAAKHNIGPLVSKLGGQQNTVRAVLNAANGKLPASGVFNNIPVNVGGQTVFIRGNVINGVPHLGTMFIK